jgi:N-acetylmuramoyl-L-alanine amidase
MTYDEYDLDNLIRTIYGEARGESDLGKLAVGCVVCNRANYALDYMQEHGQHHPLYGDGTPAGACRVPYQFSCWNKNDPNYQIIFDLDIDSEEAEPCALAAETALDDPEDDPSNGATHYHTKNVHPAWANGKEPCAEIGAHLFYDLGITG